MQATDSSEVSQKVHIIQRLKCKDPSLKAWKRARSLARIKVSAFGAEDRGFKSLRARSLMVCIGLFSVCFWQELAEELHVISHIYTCMLATIKYHTMHQSLRGC
jgi:hypothetical protein